MVSYDHLSSGLTHAAWRAGHRGEFPQKAEVARTLVPSGGMTLSDSLEKEGTHENTVLRVLLVLILMKGLDQTLAGQAEAMK